MELTWLITVGHFWVIFCLRQNHSYEMCFPRFIFVQIRLLAPGLILKQWHKVTQKWRILFLLPHSMWSCILRSQSAENSDLNSCRNACFKGILCIITSSVVFICQQPLSSFNFLSFIGQELTTWPTNDCLQVMNCLFVISSKCVLASLTGTSNAILFALILCELIGWVVWYVLL